MSKQGGSGPDLDKMEEGRGFFYFYTELQSYKWVDMVISKAKVLKEYKEGSCRNRRGSDWNISQEPQKNHAQTIALWSGSGNLAERGRRQKDKVLRVLSKVHLSCLLSQQSFLKKEREPVALDGGLCGGKKKDLVSDANAGFLTKLKAERIDWNRERYQWRMKNSSFI